MNERIKKWICFSKKLLIQIQEHPSAQALPYWLGATATGFVAVLYAKAFYKIGMIPIMLYHRHPYWLLVFSPLCFIGGWWLVHRYAPEAAGSGIPQLLAAGEMQPQTQGRQLHALLGIKTGIIKILSSLFCVMGGGAIGREGPTLQISAMIFYYMGQRFKKILPRTTHHSWIVVGGAAGIASAFNTPLGGIVYAIEELATTHFNQFRTMLIFAVIISGLMAQWILGPYLYVGFPKIQSVTFSFIPYALSVGIVTGVLGAFFGKGLFYFSQQKMKIKSTTKLLLLVGFLGLGIALLALFVNPYSMGSGIEAISEILFQKNETATFSLVFARFVGTWMSYLSGCAGGIFSPSLALGAVIGSKFAILIHFPDQNLMVLLGMIGFLTAVIRAPFTAFVLVLEMTDRPSAIFPMMLAALSAFAIAKLIDSQSFYERVKNQYLNTLIPSTD
jgi:H+/Cl- antiporter ClcA